MFNQDVIAAVKAAKFCRVVIYPPVRGWCGERVQLEVADEIDALGHTDQLRGAGHWLVQSTTPERVAEEAARLRAAPVLVLRGGDSFGVVDNYEREGLANQ
ncbi:hypothetical protein KAM448_05500 [Aeromonas caviae]|uniref:Uncharacterized protein n=1 Tax=Aeromonas caviae TaxID=648 RepID=A0ABD0B9P9_AERCA|nr:hypothetical protein [Aeromonas caviae]BCR29920.1 hypothetical protein KAM376_29260 [Aeromonas caviae]GJA81027.1 hypothetical protein KAM355_15870 [Aeromonas caviae]GJA98474.1 hypothetical protein KAM359_18820 [Aeromonas caviae]GJB10764.1 hypothetical protein KAM362_13240 [Aeromonas caviae]GJB23380.1 hypothetical protein KAM365_11300 [Aeromonas caviae]